MGASLADQVRSVEIDNDELRSRVSQIEATNQILEMENARLVEQCDQLIRQNTEVRAMAEKLASDALDMLRAGRRENFKPANDPYAPKHQTGQVEQGAVREVREVRKHSAVGAEHVTAKQLVENVADKLADVKDGLIDFARSGGSTVITNTPRAGESAEATAVRSAPRTEPMRSADFLYRDSAFDVAFVESNVTKPQQASVLG